jgi:1,4-dihydroxy-2-naphthoate octaprenyltransferase
MVLGFVPAYLAYRILDQIARFGEDHRLEKVSFVTQTGWAKGMTFHNALILLTFFLFALVSLIKIPWFLMWPVFLSLPIGLLEIWLMERVRAGGKPLWRVMKFASAMVFFLPVYLLAFAFWIR